MTVTESPATSISVILCTRDRPAQLARAIAAILRGTRRDFELIVVDQSASDVSAAALSAASADDGRVTLVRDHGVGASRARNIGAATAHGGILVFTDDDCEAKADWLERLVAALEADDAVGIAFGAVIPAPCDPRDGFIVGFVPDRRRRLTGRLGKWFDSGISANMALRRTALEAVGGFDEMLGTGAYFPSAEDIDIAYRVLRAGFPLLHVPGSVVIHYGLRDWRSGSALMRRTYLAVAAAYMKHIRLGDAVAWALMLQQIGQAVVTIVVAASHARRPLGLGRLWSLFVGMRRSFSLDVDPQRALYRAR